MQADIVSLLRQVHHVTYETGWESSDLAGYAAAEITRLRKGCDLLREALDAANRRADDARAMTLAECLDIAEGCVLHVPLIAGTADGASMAARQIASAIRVLQSRE